MKPDPEFLSMLTREGHLQTPLWCLTGPADRVAKFRDLWRESYEGQMSVLKATLRKLDADIRHALEVRVW